MSVFQALMWVFSGPGAGALSYWLMENVPRLKGMDPQRKRFFSLLLAPVLAGAAWLLAVALQYVAVPEAATVQWWADGVLSVMIVALLVSQGVHGYKKLPGKAAALGNGPWTKDKGQQQQTKQGDAGRWRRGVKK